jgi:hypothetical protein
MLLLSKISLLSADRLIYRDWHEGQRLYPGLNLNLHPFRIALWCFPYWFPFYGKYFPEDRFEKRLSLVLPVFGVGLFKRKGNYCLSFRYWRRELVREPFGMSSKEALLILSDVSNYSGALNFKEVSYALWSLKKRGWSVDRIMERVNG